ncbi:alpha/beta fold hydrolase [Pseudoroseomonas cervicalis]|uniref:alpha/beta fold hydrolase n=1 Tax=Teichococcus cervicalis TaxID=204525 RepID=UPI002781D989|nr:alpha/beta hydrolase [Pseudoroseomonas cervicalis]MDQ1077916.1 pimeloyl-ACP methyl ester carboxylesterase [Pseudoroseomonas cervicalis]
MPAFLIHGVSETHRLWTPLLGHLARRDIVALDLPGFGSPVPAGFDASKEAYVDWLIARLEAASQPVDLVAHDWGCILALRVASLRPDLVRSFVAGGGVIDPAYEWHPLARIWQTPGEGEAYFARFDPAPVVERLTQDGVPPARAAETAAGVDRVMGGCILRLYRSALEVGREWAPGLAHITAPGLVLHGLRDRACPQAFAERMAAAGAGFQPLDSGHWFPLHRPAEMAAAVQRHWAEHGLTG